MTKNHTEMCDRAAESILSGKWRSLPSSDPIRPHITSCPECQSRIQEVRFFSEVFSSDEPRVGLKRSSPRTVAIPLPAARREPRVSWTVTVVKFASLAAAACLVALLAWNYFQPEGIGRVAALQGEATVRRFGERDDERLEESDRIYLGDVVRTEAGSKLCLQLEENNSIHLNESTEIRIEAPRQLHHNTGETWFEIAKGRGEFEVETRGADVLVLGTSFGVQYVGDQVRVPVASGRVRLQTKGGEIELTPGQIGSYPTAQAFLPPKRQTEIYPDAQPQWLLPLNLEVSK
jgi:hypothetical protein